jgi:hypothetical protein
VQGANIVCYRPPSDAAIPANPIHYRKTLVESIHGLDFQSFVPKVRLNQRYHFYLLFPSAANQTAIFITNWLRESSNQCRIYSSQTEGAWNFFVKDPKVDIGIVLIHESAIATVSISQSLSS